VIAADVTLVKQADLQKYALRSTNIMTQSLLEKSKLTPHVHKVRQRMVERSEGLAD
jgi:hypothetical protein